VHACSLQFARSLSAIPQSALQFAFAASCFSTIDFNYVMVASFRRFDGKAAFESNPNNIKAN
jgi:hypothetical protein